jgi:hypothetical protein
VIVVISDVHLQHTATEVVRHRDASGAWETGVRRNVSPDAVGLLFAEMADAAARRQPREIHLVLAGDMFECHRTPLWFAGDDAWLRPTDPAGPDGSPLCKKTRRVLEAVAAENAAFLTALRDRVAGGVAGVPVRLHYLPGNHDRLVNLWPSTREYTRALLGMGPSDAPFPHVLDWPAADGGAGVRVRHGHEYDAVNITLRDGQPDYDAPTLGDFVTIDIAGRFAMAFRVHHARGLRTPGPEGDVLRGLYAALTEFDDVRPSTLLPNYLALRAGADRAEILRLLRPVLLDVYAATVRDAFFARESTAQGFHLLFGPPFATLLRAGISNLPAPVLARAVGALARLDARHAGPHLAAAAAQEVGLGESFRTVVAGHTHQPGLVPIPAPGPGEAWFVNSGTWRMRVDVGVGTYGRVRAGTLVYCYDDAESARSADGRRIETWTGFFAAARMGAYTERVPESHAPARRLLLRALDVIAVPEGRTPHGAELHVEIGVDAASQVFTPTGVHDGDHVDLGGVALALDPDLDGEVWAHGFERDGGIDPDDALPWGVDYLPRHPGSRAYVLGERVLVMGGYDRSGVLGPRLRVRVEVV